MGKTAFVSGGTGFVGLNLIEQLVAGGWRVVALRRPASRLDRLARPGISFAIGDATDRQSLLDAMPHAVFHVAADVSL